MASFMLSSQDVHLEVALKVLIKNDDGSCVSETRNVVYREVLDGANAASA